MIKVAQTATFFLSTLLMLPWYAHAQAVPAGLGPRFFQGFTVPDTAGSLHYSLNASERLLFGYNAANSQANNTLSQTNLGADVGYLSASEHNPLSVLYSGGYLITTANQPSAFYHSLEVSQTIDRKHWNLMATDSFRYLPETPTGGLSGLAGIGNPGVPPIGSVGGSGQGILTPFATRIDNIVAATFRIPVTGATSVDFTGSDSIVRFPSTTTAIENNVYSGGGGVFHRINALNSIQSDYTYRQFNFLNLNGSFVVQDVTVGYTRHWSRKVVTLFSAGPQFTSGSLLAKNTSSLDYTVTVHGAYTGSDSTLSADYLRATNSGSGVTYGARNDTVRVTAGHGFSRQTAGSLTFAYARTQGLAVLSSQSFQTSSLLGMAQVNHELTPSINTFASYTAENQTISGLARGVTPLNGLVQILGFGISYSPRPIRVGKH